MREIFTNVNKSLSSQIHKVFLITFIIGCLISFILFIPSEINKFKAFVNRIDELLITLIDAKKGRIAFDIYMKNDASMTKLIEDFLGFEGIQAVDVFDVEGKLLKSTETKEPYMLDINDEEFQANFSLVRYNLFKGAHLEYTCELVVAGDTSGYMRLYYSMDKILRQTVVSTILIVGFIIIIFFVYMFIIDKLLKNVVRMPLEKLGKGMQEIEKGNLGVQIDINIGNEIDAITDTFNKMSRENKELYERLNKMNKDLETTVAQRTQELKQKNISLEMAKVEAEKLALEAKKANRAKSEFLANMSHEIRTPLNGVIGFAELLTGTSMNELQRKYAENIVLSADVLLNIISDILDFSKIEAGKLELELMKTDIRKLIQETGDILEYQAMKKELEMKLTLEKNLPTFGLFDPVRLKQVLVNLIGNAIKFTEEGTVEVKVGFDDLDEEKGTFHFQVKDTGIGISQEQKKRLFKAFSQADTSITRKYGGTGLGLVISNMLLKKMGSSLNVESKPAKGSVFSFSIITKYTDEGEKVYKGEPEKENLTVINGSPRILIVEDVSVNRELIKNFVRQMIPDVKTDEAEDGLKAVKKAKDYQYDMILMDIQMPKMGGLEATKKIRENESEGTGQVPIIALSAEVIKETMEKGKAVGMNDFLSKPINQKTLNDLLKKYLQPL